MIKKFKQFKQKYFKRNESGQGVTEYILLLVVVIAIVALFKDKIKSAVTDKVGELSGQIGGFKGD